MKLTLLGLTLLAGCCQGSLQGKVYTGKPPAPLAGASVVAFAQSGEVARAETSSDGSYSIGLPCRSERYRVGVFEPDAESPAVVDTVRLVGGGEVQRNYQLNGK